MKRIDELTHDELIELTDEQINKYIDIELAEEGVKPVLPPEEPTYEEATLIPDQRFYSVLGLIFKDKAVAIEVASKEIYKTDYNFNIGYDYKFPQKETNLEIREEFLFDKQKVLAIAPILQGNRIKKERYDKENSAYKDYLRKTEQYRERVYGAINEAKEREREILNAVNSFNHYKEIADNDERIAVRFFEKAFKETSDEIKDIALKRCGVDNAV